MSDSAAVRSVEAGSGEAGQRIDNFLLRELRGVPRGHVYRLLRRGEVRVNGRRVRPTQRLVEGDRVRIPPVRDERHADGRLPAHLLARLRDAICYEDERVLVVDKPAGIAVHAGSGLGGGVIDGLRALRPELRELALVHRLDRDTSGCLLLAKGRATLRELQRALRERSGDKQYQAVLLGEWSEAAATVDAALHRDRRAGGERVVRVDADRGRPARSHFRRLAVGGGLTRVAVRIESGRTHQIRVHAAHLGHPVLGDAKYGRRRDDRARLGRPAPRLFLHAEALRLPLGDDWLDVSAPVPDIFATVLATTP